MMINLRSDLEKKLWRQSALAALRTVEGITASEEAKTLAFATVIADGFILAYRKRCQNVKESKESK